MKKNVDGSTGNQGMIIKWAEIQLKHSNIKFLLKVQWSDGECAQS